MPTHKNLFILERRIPDQIQGRIEEDPHYIDKMPVYSSSFYRPVAFADELPLPALAVYHSQEDQSRQHVKCVETGHGVEQGP